MCVQSRQFAAAHCVSECFRRDTPECAKLQMWTDSVEKWGHWIYIQRAFGQPNRHIGYAAAAVAATVCHCGLMAWAVVVRQHQWQCAVHLNCVTRSWSHHIQSPKSKMEYKAGSVQCIYNTSNHKPYGHNRRNRLTRSRHTHTPTSHRAMRLKPAVEMCAQTKWKVMETDQKWSSRQQRRQQQRSQQCIHNSVYKLLKQSNPQRRKDQRRKESKQTKSKLVKFINGECCCTLVYTRCVHSTCKRACIANVFAFTFTHLPFVSVAVCFSSFCSLTATLAQLNKKEHDACGILECTKLRQRTKIPHAHFYWIIFGEKSIGVNQYFG